MSASGYVEDTCTVSQLIPPVFNCHSASTCSSIPVSSKAPVAHPTPPWVSCVQNKLVHFPVYVFSYDPDGDELRYQVRTLPQYGVLYEVNEFTRLPDAMHNITQIDAGDLPYNQTEFITPFFKYQHTPSDPLDVKPTDSFVVAYSDGSNWTEVRSEKELRTEPPTTIPYHS